MKNFYIIILIIPVLLSGCKNTDWGALYRAGEEEQEKYRNTLSDENYKKALKLFDQVIKGSPEYRNSALMQSSVILTWAERYDEAIRMAEQISDTAKVLQMYCNKKTVYINMIYANKAMSRYDFDEHDIYSKKMADEMRPYLYERKQLIYEAINKQHEFYSDSGTKTLKLYDPNLQALIIYFMALDSEEAREEIHSWKTGLPETNEATEAFFNFFDF